MQITREVIFVLHGPLLFKPVIFSTSFKTNLFIKTLIGEVEKRKKTTRETTTFFFAQID